MSFPIVTPTSRNRADFNAILDYERNQLGNKTALPLPGYIRSDVLLTGPTQSIDFPIKQTLTFPGQSLMGVENRLKDNDAFYVQDVSVLWRLVDETGVNFFGDSSELHSYGNPAVFLPMGALLIEQALQGKLSARVDETVYIDALDGVAFKRVDTAQRGVAVSDAMAANLYQQSAWLNDEMFKELQPMIRMNGQGNNQWRYQFPQTLDFTPQTDEVARTGIVLYLRGFYVQNAGTARIAR